MDDRPQRDIWLTAAECARRTGLSARALRLYERHGLIMPRRTEKQWRLYGEQQIARLNEIIALKALGLSLARIADLLGGRSTDMKLTLDLQREALRDVQARAERGLALIAAMQMKVDAGQLVALDDLTTLIKETKMSDTDEALAWRRYEQNRPRTEVPVDAALYRDYAGAYQLDNGPYYSVITHDGRLFVRVVGQAEVEIFPESETEFFMKPLPVQVSFIRDADGAVNSLVHHQGGTDTRAVRVDPARLEQAEADLHRRVRDKVALPDSEAIMRRLITEQIAGRPDYAAMSPALAALARQQADLVRGELNSAGALKSLTFLGVNSTGCDTYRADFEGRSLTWGFDLAPDGKIGTLFFRLFP